MRAVRAVAGQPAVVDVDEPGGDWVLLDVGAVGICGSDLTLLKWNLPTTLGHEIAGTVDGSNQKLVVGVGEGKGKAQTQRGQQARR